MQGDLLIWKIDVISICFGGKKPVNPGGGKTLFGNDSLKKLFCFRVEFFSDLPPFFIPGFEGLGFGVPNTTKFPGVEERGPVDIVCEFAEGLGFNGAGPGEFRNRRVVVFPFDSDLVGTGLLDGESFLLLTSVKFLSSSMVILFVGIDEFLAIFGQKGGGDGNRSGSVENVNKWTCIMFRNFDGGMGGAGCCSADKDWNISLPKTSFFGLLGDGDHFVERRGNEPREADYIGVVFLDGI